MRTRLTSFSSLLTSLLFACLLTTKLHTSDTLSPASYCHYNSVPFPPLLLPASPTSSRTSDQHGLHPPYLQPRRGEAQEEHQRASPLRLPLSSCTDPVPVDCSRNRPSRPPPSATRPVPASPPLLPPTPPVRLPLSPHLTASPARRPHPTWRAKRAVLPLLPRLFRPSLDFPATGLRCRRLLSSGRNRRGSRRERGSDRGG